MVWLCNWSVNVLINILKSLIRTNIVVSINSLPHCDEGGNFYDIFTSIMMMLLITFVKNSFVKECELLILLDLGYDISFACQFGYLLRFQCILVQGLELFDVGEFLCQVTNSLIDCPENWVIVPLFLGDQGGFLLCVLILLLCFSHLFKY